MIIITKENIKNPPPMTPEMEDLLWVSEEIKKLEEAVKVNKKQTP